jgi:hypothetical protein
MTDTTRPDKKALLQWAHNYVKYWNAGDLDAWVANWKTVSTGEHRMLDPVGTPEKVGFQQCCLDAWALFQPRVRFNIPEGQLFVCDNEVAWLLENHFDGPDGPQLQCSIETYRFEDDGSVIVRTYYRVPSHDNAAIGDIFQRYLPGDGAAGLRNQ